MKENDQGDKNFIQYFSGKTQMRRSLEISRHRGGDNIEMDVT
jgi:hypothetical protein